MSNYCLIQNTFFIYFDREHEYLQITVSLLFPRDLEMINYMGKVMAVASMYPACRIVFKPIKCVNTSSVDHYVIEKL